ncbi:MAG TPA: winged helix-turn-helix domain-containing protein, partial [Dehalococcoidia bacterium]|jgi:hypothetical protein
MSRDAGEVPDAVQAASALEIKRRYMELRPQLRRIYTAMRDITQLTQAAPLGLFPVPGTDPLLDGVPYHTLMLDFGPESVDGWLAGLVAAELGMGASEPLLDREAREAVLGARRVALTKLEFGLLDALAQREGKPVSRATLMEDVWGYRYDGDSNVVEVAVAGLRKKLGDRAALVETVHGIGYRLRRP